MKLFDKVKNMFTEEVEEEVQVEQIKPKKEKTRSSIETFNQIKEEELKKEEVKKPIFFTDDDFNDMDIQRKTIEKENKANVQPKVEEPKVEEKKEEEPKIEPYRATRAYEEVKPKKFKPTPIISPVYGILDKNYHKEDIVNKTDDYQSVDGMSVDSIRNKAYGTLEDELENTLFGNNSILFNEEVKEEKENFFDEVEEEANNDLLDELTDEEENLRDLENITMDIGKELDSLLSKKEETNDENEDDLFDLIDSMYEGNDE